MLADIDIIEGSRKRTEDLSFGFKTVFQKGGRVPGERNQEDNRY